MKVCKKLDYAKFGVSSLFFFSKVIEEKPLGVRPDPPPLGKGKVHCRTLLCKSLTWIEMILPWYMILYTV